VSKDSNTPENKPKSSEHRASPRYRLSSPPEVEILHAAGGTAVQARLGDLSSGGCFVETDYLPPVGTELTVTLKKSGDKLSGQAQVVRVSPNEGLALVFTSMDAEDFRTLQSWLSIYVATEWVAKNRRRTERIAMPVEVSVSGYNAEGVRFTERTKTIEISGFGCLVTLRTPVSRGKRVALINPQTKRTVECLVAYHEANGDEMRVGLAFVTLNQPFWPVEFENVDWSGLQPDTKNIDS
jgi:hypothetical protein